MLTSVLCANFFLAAAKPPPAYDRPAIYFTIYAEDKRIDVTDEYLRGNWYFYESQKKFRDGRSLYERAQKATSVKKDFPEIWSIIKKLQNDVEVKPYDGHITFNPHAEPDKRFRVVNRRSGRDLDEAQLSRDILAALKSGEYRSIAARVRQTQPCDPDDLLSRITLRGGYTTYFEDNDPREHNIGLACQSLNGLVIPNGETVSFNKIVGRRCVDRGYQEAKIILDGEFVPGVGGGVCQVSTTLFNAVLLAGLRIDKSYNHSLAVGYVPIGRDAMVSSAADLRFTNETGGTVYIEAGAQPAGEGPGACWVRIYGNKTNVKYQPRTVVTEEELREGEIDPARAALTYIEAWNGEKLVNSKLVRKSKYRAVKEKREPTV